MTYKSVINSAKVCYTLRTIIKLKIYTFIGHFT